MSSNKKKKSTKTLTFSERVENHSGMQQIGDISDKGFSKRDLNKAKSWFENKECKVKIT